MPPRLVNTEENTRRQQKHSVLMIRWLPVSPLCAAKVVEKEASRARQAPREVAVAVLEVILDQKVAASTAAKQATMPASVRVPAAKEDPRAEASEE